MMMDVEEFRTAGHKLIDYIADYHKNLDSKNVVSQVLEGEISNKLPDTLPEEPVDFDNLLDHFETQLSDGLTHWQHPKNFAYFPGNHTFPAILGHILSIGLGNLSVNWQSSPVISELQTKCTEWIRDFLNFPPSWTAVLQDSASTSSLCSFIVARERVTTLADHPSADCRGGNVSIEKATCYIGEHSHSSIMKGTRLAGWLPENIRVVESNGDFNLCPNALLRAVKKDIDDGYTPGFVCATRGTTGLTAADDVRSIGEICKKYKIWLHVDMAMVGAAMILPEMKDQLWDGLELADTCVINGHKWLGFGLPCSFLFVQSMQLYHDTFNIASDPSYLVGGTAVKGINLRSLTVPLGSSFKILGTYFSLRLEGPENMRDRLRVGLKHAQMFKHLVENSSKWEIMAPTLYQTVLIRYRDEDCNFQKKLVNIINNSGKSHVTGASFKFGWAVRVSFGVTNTEDSHVIQFWDEINDIVVKMLRTNKDDYLERSSSTVCTP